MWDINTPGDKKRRHVLKKSQCTSQNCPTEVRLYLRLWRSHTRSDSVATHQFKQAAVRGTAVATISQVDVSVTTNPRLIL